MKIFKFLFILIIAIYLVNCSKKEKETNNSAILNVIQSHIDNQNGTVTDPNGKVWMKCTYGQVWDSNTNLCSGTGGGTTYGARSVAACTTAGSCFDSSTLLLNSGPAFKACDELDYAGFSDWRLPTKYELAGLAQSLVNRSAFLIVFPQTPDDKFFWTANVSETDQRLAVSVNFSETDFGKEFTRTTTTVQYVRCVRP